MSYRVIAGEQVEGENSTKFVNELGITRVSWVGRENPPTAQTSRARVQIARTIALGVRLVS